MFSRFVSAIFNEYHSRLDALPLGKTSEFLKIESLIGLHFRFWRELSGEALLVAGACPARLNDPEGICRVCFDQARRKLMGYLCGCLESGVDCGEFHPLPIRDTAAVLIELLVGLLRRHGVKPSARRAGLSATVEFCRRALVAGDGKPEARSP